MQPRRPSSFLCLATCMAISGAAFAGQGQVELNQTCATLSGCLPGDAPGFPISIGQSGSYRLTSDLFVGDVDVSAIDVDSSDVQIDLGGFTVSSRTLCSGSPLSCSPTGSGRGIDIDLVDPPERLVVRNGVVRGFGNRGVLTGASATLEDLHVMHNAIHGIETSGRSSVRRCEVALNGSIGVVGATGAVIEGSIVSSNGGVGVSVSASLVSRNVISSNGSTGLVMASGGSAIGNLVSGNRGDGIVTTVGSASLDANTTIDNGIVGAPSEEDGVQCNSPCNVRNHTSSGNDGLGLNLVSGSSYGQSMMSGNALGGVVGGTNAGSNACSGTGVGSASCP